MFSEISQIMNHAAETDDISSVLSLNVSNKRSNNNLVKTNNYLKQLYLLDPENMYFKCFKHYWMITDKSQKAILSILFAINNDFLLSESVNLVASAPLNQRLDIQQFDDNIEKYNPNKYSPNTRRSAAQNVASSWKQAGYLLGKIKNIRVIPELSPHAVAFAMLLAYLNGDRGDFILSSKLVKALALSSDQLRSLIREAANIDLLNYQFGGSVTTISFENQLKTIE